jgi:hypothetical protein
MPVPSRLVLSSHIFLFSSLFFSAAAAQPSLGAAPRSVASNPLLLSIHRDPRPARFPQPCYLRQAHFLPATQHPHPGGGRDDLLTPGLWGPSGFLSYLIHFIPFSTTDTNDANDTNDTRPLLLLHCTRCLGVLAAAPELSVCPRGIVREADFGID